MLQKGLNGHQRQAVLNKACVAGRKFTPDATDEEILRGVLTGDLQIVIQYGEQVLFDRHGRRIPPSGLIGKACDANRAFYLNQPPPDYAGRLARLQSSGLQISVSVDDFKGRSEAILAKVGANEQIKNLLKGVYLSVVIPQTNLTDLGELTEKFVAVAGDAYRRQFPNRPFTNHRAGELAEQVSIVESSRYQRLLDAMAQGLVVGMYFPACLQGFSIHAQREQMKILPEQFILSGPIEASMSWLMYPDILGRDFNTPGYDCSAVSWQSADYSLYFGADDDNADFDGGADLGGANADYSGGLLLLG